MSNRSQLGLVEVRHLSNLGLPNICKLPGTESALKICSPAVDEARSEQLDEDGAGAVLKHHPTAYIHSYFDPPAEVDSPRRQETIAPLVLPPQPLETAMRARISELGLFEPLSDSQRISVRRQLEHERSIEVAKLRTRHNQAHARVDRAAVKRQARREARWAAMAPNVTEIVCAGMTFKLNILNSEGVERAMSQETTAQLLGQDERMRYYWWYRNSVYSSAENLTADDVAALQRASEARKERKLQRARAQLLDNEPPRERISDDVKIFVWRRDGGACIRCSGRTRLEFDHIIPVSLGGATTARNLQVLCEDCNRSKGAHVV